MSEGSGPNLRRFEESPFQDFLAELDPSKHLRRAGQRDFLTALSAEDDLGYRSEIGPVLRQRKLGRIRPGLGRIGPLRVSAHHAESDHREVIVEGEGDTDLTAAHDHEAGGIHRR